MKITRFSSLIILLCMVCLAFICGCGSNPTSSGGSSPSITLLSISGTVTVSPETNLQLASLQTRSGMKLAQLFISPAYAANLLEPLTNANIKVYEYSNPTTEIAATTTDNEGKYNVKGLPLNQVYLIIAKKNKGTIEATIKNIAWGLTNNPNKTVNVNPKTSVVVEAVKGNAAADEMLGSFGAGADIDTAVINIAQVVDNYYLSNPLPSVTVSSEIVVPTEISSSVEAMEYTLSVSIEGTGTVALTPQTTGNKYLKDTVVQMQANPGSGYVFDSWSGSLTGATNPSTIALNGNKAVSAVFIPGIFNAPQILSPANGTNYTPSWDSEWWFTVTLSSIAGATKYQFLIATDEAFTATFVVTRDANVWNCNFDPWMNHTTPFYIKARVLQPSVSPWSGVKGPINFLGLSPYPATFVVPTFSGTPVVDGLDTEWSGIPVFYSQAADDERFDDDYATGYGGTNIKEVKLAQKNGTFYIYTKFHNGNPNSSFFNENYLIDSTGGKLQFGIKSAEDDLSSSYHDLVVMCGYNSCNWVGQPWWHADSWFREIYSDLAGAQVDVASTETCIGQSLSMEIIEISMPISEITSNVESTSEVYYLHDAELYIQNSTEGYPNVDYMSSRKRFKFN